MSTANKQDEILIQEAIILDMKDVVRKPIKWFWRDRFQSEAVNSISGNQEVGKSTLALYMAAKVVAGGYWPYLPDEKIDTGSVIILSTEDNLAQIIAPKLDALALNMKPLEGNRIVTIAGIKETDIRGKVDGRWLENLTKDSDVLLDAIKKVGNVRLVIIDPIVDFAGDKKENSNADIRDYLTGLKRIAENNHLAILGLSHLNKDSQKIAAHRTLGSVAWTAYPRTAWIVERDPEDEERRCLLKIKCNGARKPLNAAFRLRNVPIIINGKPEGYPVCDFEAEPISITADDILNVDLRRKKQTKIDNAKDWLELFLSQGPQLSVDVLSAALKKGIAQATLYRAKDKLQVKIHDNRVEGKNGESKWALSG